MSFVRDFFLPLIPFLVEAILRVWMISGQAWWFYFDSGTLLLTFSVWALLVLSSVPRVSRIERDDEVLDKLDKVRNHFGVLVCLGFILFGLVTFLNVSIDRSTQTPFADKDMQMLAIMTIIFCMYCCFYIFSNRNSIDQVIKG